MAALTAEELAFIRKQEAAWCEPGECEGCKRLIRKGWRNVATLMPYLVNAPRDLWRGEHPAYCPVHEDSRPSASFNFRKGVWHCHACGAGGSIRTLLETRGYWIAWEEHPRFQAVARRFAGSRK